MCNPESDHVNLFIIATLKVAAIPINNLLKKSQEAFDFNQNRFDDSKCKSKSPTYY